MSDLRIFTVDELRTILAKHAEWLVDSGNGKCADLRNADLSYADLSYADLRYADLRNANLRNADLSYANLRYADLSDADLRNADLRNADLRDADLSDADLSDANLRNADLRNANLRYADLSDADLSDANLSDADLILIGQDMRGYLFYGFKNDKNVLVIRAGCRQFVGVNAARSHWTERHTADEVLHEDCLSLVDRAERMAKVRGWKTEVEAA